jgi:hypothetical protein
MAPEQARGVPADARSDLFSLGCVLYRMATGRLPFHGQDAVATLLKLATEDPPAPRQLNPAVPIELSAMIEKLLAKSPDVRYASAQDVVDALEDIERRRRPRRIGRWLLATAVCTALAVIGTFGLTWYAHRPAPPVEVTFDYDEPDAILVLQGGDGAEQEIDVHDSASRQLAPGAYAVRPRTTVKQRQLVPDHFVVEPDRPLKVALRLVGLIRTYDGHTQGITTVAFVPGAPSRFLSASLDYDLRLWDARTENEGERLVGHQSPVHCLAVAPDGKYAVSGSGKPLPRNPDLFVRVWDLDRRTCTAELAGHDSSVIAIACAPDGTSFMSGDRSGIVIFWDAGQRRPIRTVAAHDRCDVNGVAFVPGGRLALSCGSDGKVLLWDTTKHEVAKTLEGHTAAITAVAAAPDGRHAATASRDGTIRVWDLPSGTSRVIAAGENEVRAVAYSPDGKRLLSGGWDKTIRLWDAQTGQEVFCFRGHHKAVSSVAFSADGRRAISGSADATINLWELPN